MEEKLTVVDVELTKQTSRNNLSTQILASTHGLESFMEVVLHLNYFFL